MPGWMTEPNWWGAIGQVASAFGILVILYQIRLARQVDENQTRWQVEATSFQIYRMLIDCPRLRPYFYDNKDVPSGGSDQDVDLRNQIYAASEMLLDYFEALVISFSAVDDRTERAWRVYMGQVYEKSPALRTFLRDHNRQFDQELHRVLNPG